MRELKSRDAGDIKVFVGGTIPPNDHEALLAAGAVRIFTSEMTIDYVLSELEAALAGTA